MSLTSEEPTADQESPNEHFFLKEDNKDGRSSEEEDEGKDENENKPDVAHTNIFATLAALQTGQLTLSQVRKYNVSVRDKCVTQSSLSLQMLAAQTPGLWQSQLASLAAKMNSEQAAETNASLDAVSLQKALIQQQQAFQLQIQNFLMLQQSGLNTALNLSSSNPLLSVDLSKTSLKAPGRSRSPSPAVKEESEEKMLQVWKQFQPNPSPQLSVV